MGVGVHYHHAKIALWAVKVEIQFPMRYAGQCPALSPQRLGYMRPDGFVRELHYYGASAQVIAEEHLADTPRDI